MSRKVIQLRVNGVEHESQLERSPAYMVDSVYNLGDWGRVFTQTESYDVPVE